MRYRPSEYWEIRLRNDMENFTLNKRSGIYSIQHIPSGKRYIGQSRNIQKRIKEHIRVSVKSKIHRAISKYGVSAFLFEIIEECPSDRLNIREVHYIKEFDSIKNGYNLTSGGEKNYSIHREVKDKISHTQRNKYANTDYLDRFNSISFSGGRHNAATLNVRIRKGGKVSFSKYQAARIFKHMCPNKNCNCQSGNWSISGGDKVAVLSALFGELH